MPSATVHARAAATATRLINRHGRPMELLVISSTGSDWRPVQTKSAMDIVGVQTKFSSHEIDGDRVRVQDKKILLASVVKPTTDMRLLDEGVNSSIINIDTTKPGLTTVIYELQVRK